MDRPEGYSQEHKDYLDDLRESGDTNMWGAGSWLAREFSIPEKQAGNYLLYWMKTFGGSDDTKRRP